MMKLLDLLMHSSLLRKKTVKLLLVIMVLNSTSSGKRSQVTINNYWAKIFISSMPLNQQILFGKTDTSLLLTTQRGHYKSLLSLLAFLPSHLVLSTISRVMLLLKLESILL
jgi:hypothetical protein